MMSWRPSLCLIPLWWFLPELWYLDFEKFIVIAVFCTFFKCLQIMSWYFVCESSMMSYRPSLRFVPLWWFLAELWPLDFEKFIEIQHFFLKCLQILSWYFVCETTMMSYRKKCLQILSWYFVCETTMMSYRPSLCFVLLRWFLSELWPLDYEKFIEIAAFCTFFSNACR